MPDVHTPEVRSYNMSRIRGKDTKPEIAVRKYLFSKGFRYRKNVKNMPGKPDIVMRKYNTCIFINGCFWHKHEGCKRFVWPKNNREFWSAKLKVNASRDQKNYEQLQNDGWNVVVIWECDLKNDFQNTMNKLEESLLLNI